ncbi:hypothetical protein FHR87_002780 [Azomonas macrocytogenes]|uniref:DUF2934 domain-containing protein n=1 Tax=Azomonas macrocytogenes TaxID=69962 RepID=A0A839T7Y1_AZOMA|nr:DUF2934 domain-containing protein [Azomonas macrocytogenes]MBB3104364.1 hypothetical protein [Azomonas macrocytogenes]
MNKNEQRIREFAYQIWQMEGCPDGQDIYHWTMACKLAEAEGNSDTTNNSLEDMTDKNNFEKDMVVAANTPPHLRENRKPIVPPK